MGISSPTKIQVKHIPDQVMIDLVDRLWNAPLPVRRGWNGLEGFYYPNGVSLHNICKYWDMIPPKVIQRKLEKLINQNYLDGCACGCSTGIRVIHEHDLPIHRWFDKVTENWKEARVPRKYYHLAAKNCTGPVNFTGQ